MYRVTILNVELMLQATLNSIQVSNHLTKDHL